MGKYYNRTGGNLPLTLGPDRSVSVPPNTWIELKGSEQTTPSVMRAVRKGQLHRKPDPPKPPKKTAPVAEPPKIASAKTAEVAPAEKPATELEGLGSESKTSKRSTRKK